MSGLRSRIRMKAFAIGLAGIVALLSLGVFTGAVSIRYARMIDNPVLSHPVAVARVVENRIILKDGRVIELEDRRPLDSSWDELRESGGEIEVDAEDGDLTVWGKKRRFVCGGTAAFRIPLIPRNVNANRRVLVGFGWWADEVAEEEEAGGRASF